MALTQEGCRYSWQAAGDSFGQMRAVWLRTSAKCGRGKGQMYRLKSRAVGRDDGKRPGKPLRAE
jgi:hypothetical protein